MREYRPGDVETTAPQTTSAGTTDAGRTTLGEATDGAVGVEYASTSLFPGANIADDGSEPPPPSGAQTRAASTETAAAPASATPDTTPSPPPDAVQVTAGDNPAALEREYGDHHQNAHGWKFEHHWKHYGAEKHRPKKDEYNSKHIKSDKIGKDVAARPGVVVGKGKHADGVFNLKPHSTAIRYTFVKRDGHDIATPYDTIEADKLAHHNFKFNHPHAKGEASGKGLRELRLLLNPAHPKTLYINGAPETCVLSWVDGLTAAWIKVSDLDGDHTKIIQAAEARASNWDPHTPYQDSSEITKHTTPYVIRNDKVARKDKQDVPKKDKGRVLDAGAHGGNNVSHYLSHDERKPAFGPQGNRLAGNVTRSAVAIAMNLPNIGEPPIALDTAQAGEMFYVMNDHGQFWRQVPVFENGAHRSDRMQTWVFGYLAMVSGDKQVPDPSRRGWVPLRTLAEANHLVTRDIKPRRH